MALKETLQAYNAKVIEKLNSLHIKLGQIAPWLGLSSDPGQSLTTDAEGKLFFKERTPEEIAEAYEGLSGVERFTTSHKTTVEEFGNGLSSKADLDPVTGKVKIEQIPQYAITNVVVAAEDTLAGFITNVNNYTFDEGDAIVIANAGVKTHYLYNGEDRALETSYSEINPGAISWDLVTDKPTDLETTSGAQDKADLAEANAKAYADSIAGGAPVDATYADITALIADQNNQLEDFIYEVLDASDDGITGKAYYFYNGTIAGTMEDYTSLTSQEVADLTAQAVIDALGYTPADDADLIPFTGITENQYGTHPAFTDQHSFNVWVLQNIGSGGSTPETLNAPEPITATSAGGDSININWTDTNS